MNHRKKYIIRCIVFIVLCTLLAISFIGCTNTYSTEDDYQNFVRWQTRYKFEQELVSLLHDYNIAYSSYIAYNERISNSLYFKDATMSIAFKFEERTILTDNNIRLVEIVKNESDEYYHIAITFDDIGTAILADITTNNASGYIEIVEIYNGNENFIIAPTFHKAVTDGYVTIYGSYTADNAKQLQMTIIAKSAERMLRQAAEVYNAKCRQYSSQYAIPEYLPSSLAVEPQYTDATAYLQKAEAVGFTA